MWKRLFFLLFLPQLLVAQAQLTEQTYLSVKPKIGFLAAHRGVMGHLPKEHCVGLEVSLYKRVAGRRSWYSNYKHPYVGGTLFMSTVGNNKILGQAIGVYGFIEFPMMNGRRHVLTGKLSTGLGYITKVFDQETNPKNVAMSSHVNALICLGIQGRFHLTPRHDLLYGLDMTHLSNGSFKTPNLGLNMPYISLGYAYRLRSKEIKGVAFDSLVAPRVPFFRNWKLNLIGIVSVKEVFPTGGRKYPVYAVSVIGRRVFRPKVGMEVALDLISKQALFAYKPYVPKSQWDIFQVGVYTSYVVPLEHLHFVIGMGYYVKDRYDADNELYHRVGMRYHFDSGLTLNLVLKSHWAKADYTEFGVGYTFKYKR